MNTKDANSEHQDPDRTDELPVFDPIAYEAQMQDAGEDLLSHTDSWAAPTPATLHAARISQLEAELQSRDSALNALRDDLQITTAAKSKVAAELGSILDHIDDLKTRLSESEDNNTELRSLYAALQLQRDELAGRAGVITEDLDRLRYAHSQAEARITDLEQQIAQNAALSAEHERLQREFLNANTQIRDLEARLQHQKSSAKNVARLFAQQYTHSDVLALTLDEHKAKLTALEQTLTDYEQQLQSAQALAAAYSEKLALAEVELRRSEDTVAETKAVLSKREAEIEQLSQRNTALTESLQVLDRESQEQRGLLTALRLELEEAKSQAATRDHRLAETEAALSDMTNHVGELTRERDAHKADLTERGTALTNTEQALVRATKNISQLDSDLVVAKQRITTLENAEAEQQAVAQRQSDELESLRTKLEESLESISRLQSEVQARDARISELTRNLESIQSADSNVQGELKRTHDEVHSLATDLNARNSRIAALESQLTAHSEALSAIRRDIERVRDRKAPATDLPVRKLVSADRNGAAHVLKEGTMTIGRTEENDVHIHSNLVSRHHARLVVGPHSVVLEDMDSTNGSYVNGKQIKKHTLQDGDVLLIGQARYRFVARGELKEA